MDDTTRERQLRRLAQQHDLMLRKSRRRDPEAVDYGTYQLIDPQSNSLAYGGEWGTDLDDVEAYLGTAPGTSAE